MAKNKIVNVGICGDVATFQRVNGLGKPLKMYLRASNASLDRLCQLIAKHRQELDIYPGRWGWVAYFDRHIVPQEIKAVYPPPGRADEPISRNH